MQSLSIQFLINIFRDSIAYKYQHNKNVNKMCKYLSDVHTNFKILTLNDSTHKIANPIISTWTLEKEKVEFKENKTLINLPHSDCRINLLYFMVQQES